VTAAFGPAGERPGPCVRDESTMGHPIYHLDLRAEQCRLRVRLNDVPLAELTARGEQPEWFAPPLNPYLVGAGNVISLLVSPLDVPDDPPAASPSASPGAFAAPRVDASVRRFEKGMPVAPGTGPLVARFDVGAELATRIAQARRAGELLAVPQVVAARFDNEVVSFAAELDQAPPITDLDALRDYAVLLRDLLRAQDLDRLVAELGPKVTAYARAYDHDLADIGDSLRAVLRSDYFARGIDTGFERGDVELVSLAGGRLWELCRAGGQPLIQTPADAEGSTMQMAVVVARVDGALRVVR
jgi:hypothetical protein